MATKRIFGSLLRRRSEQFYHGRHPGFLAPLQNHGSANPRKRTIRHTLFAGAPRQQPLQRAAYSHSSVGHRAAPGESDGEGLPSIPERLVSIHDDNCEEILDRIPLEDVRNFCFIAHVDHGKSSLTSRLLEITGNMGRESQRVALESARANAGADGIGSENGNGETGIDGARDPSKDDARAPPPERGDEKEQIQILDTLAVERERGITVKASAASMLYPHPSAVGPDGVLLLNCVDTPGHSDFSSEVARSLAFVQGAVLLLDATQGIQAQSWTVHETAKSMADPPELILAMTKIDLDAARPIDVALTVSEWLSVDDPESIVPTSARSRIGIVPLLDAICRRVPPPGPLPDDTDGDTGDHPHLRAQVVDSWYDARGVNCLVRVISGSIREGDRIAIAGGTGAEAPQSPSSTQSFSVQEVGIVLPANRRTGKLRRGQMGYVRFGLRDPRQADPGTVLVFQKDVGKDICIPALNQSAGDGNNASASNSNSVLYASVHPQEEDGFQELCDAVDRLALNDKGLDVKRTADAGSSGSESGGPFLGPGLRVGFQGLLHVEVFRQRLSDEFGIEAVVTPPKVPYHVTLLPSKSNNLVEPITTVVEDLEDWPSYGTKFRVEEPMVQVRIMAPVEYTGAVMELITNKRGTDLTTKTIDKNSWMFEAQMPWAEVVVNFHDMLKTATAGYGSLDTSEADPPLREARLSKVDVFLNGEPVGPLSFVSHTPNAQADARVVCKKLQEVLPRQQFVTVIQAKADGKIVASERIRAYRKDVLNKSGKMVGGGDISRKKKLLEKQKQGKKRSQQSGKVTLSQAAFNSVISR
ncbi:unnamed protein product [Pseudo-nitzschia multistriata]|uniref:Tr-type G domain-containing protein n=1 Tax=Pseudo-nitzschia multistriata TaxID=183589 RepID=A0A448ZD43_9STRA|nr:unnamed protein product [Pseudo-nitzschia multistriata]